MSTVWNMNPIYSVVTFGSPSRRVQSYFSGRNALQRAKSAASGAVGSGSCCTARVYECETRRLATTATISEVRDGERVVWQA